MYEGNNNKEIQRKRMLSYFIEATCHVIETEGLGKVTLRKIAAEAGYNSATLYNYFEDLDHLTFFASMKYLYAYTTGISDQLQDADTALERFYKIWEFFLTESYHAPEIFFNIFFNKRRNELKSTIQEYYDVFPEELGVHPEQITAMLRGRNIWERNAVIMAPLVEEGVVTSDEMNIINDLTIHAYQGWLYDLTIVKEEERETVNQCMSLIRYVIERKVQTMEK